MFKFKLADGSLEKMVTRFRARIHDNLINSLDQIRGGFQQQLRIEQTRGDSGGWMRLESSYLKRKEREYPGQPILSRTGVMMKGYIKGVRTDPFNNQVIVDFPGNPGFPVYRRARIHQLFGVGKSKTIRPIPVSEQGYEDFKNIAIKEFSKAISKSLNE